MKYKKLKISLAVIIIVGGLVALGAFWFMDFFTTPTSRGQRNITDMQNYYNADAEIAQALGKLKNNPEKASVITRTNSGKRHIALTFDGLTDATSIQRILNLLKKHNAKATFFVDGIQAGETPQTIINIKKAGQKIENYTFTGRNRMEKLPAERLVIDFCRAQKIIKVNVDQGPHLLKCNDTVYTDQLLQAATACGFKSVVKSDAFFDEKKITSLEAAEKFVRGIKPGSIVSMKLIPYIEPVLNEPGKTDDKPAVEKKPDLKEIPELVVVSEKTIIETVERFLVALKKANYTTVFVEDFLPTKTAFLKTNAVTANNAAAGVSAYLRKIAGLMQEQVLALFSIRTAYAATESSAAQEIKLISTIEPALSFTFSGITNEVAVNAVLNQLYELNIKGTFFIFEMEMKRFPEILRKIIASGHEIGLAINPKAEETFEQTLTSIRNGRKMLKEQFGVETGFVKQPFGNISYITKQAVKASGCKLIGQYVTVVQSKHKEYRTSNAVMAELFGRAVHSLGRGYIVHFRMNFYSNPLLASDLIRAIKARKVDNIAYVTSFDNPLTNPANNSRYIIKPVGEILYNTKFVYQYPVDPADIPEYLRSDEPVVNFDRDSFVAEFSKRYIGNADVDDSETIDGFSNRAIRRLDKSGLIRTDENVIFLTFDDWGTDAAINKLIYVLRKHNVHGTFFIITNNILHNPNLLRAIAAEGHTIASHSDQHRPLVSYDSKGKRLPPQTKEELTEDFFIAYKKLQDVIGDVVIDGKPALTRYFRSPTLAISKIGGEAMFETGYEYLISGSYSTQDYDAENVSYLVRRIKEGIYGEKDNMGEYEEKARVNKGAILVMHMADLAGYTAMAIDIVLTANAAKKNSDPTKFKVGRISDYLTENYNQIKPKRRF